MKLFLQNPKFAMEKKILSDLTIFSIGIIQVFNNGTFFNLKEPANAIAYLSMVILLAILATYYNFHYRKQEENNYPFIKVDMGGVVYYTEK